MSVSSVIKEIEAVITLFFPECLEQISIAQQK